MNQVPEKLYLGQNRKQYQYEYVMKEAVIYKIIFSFFLIFFLRLVCFVLYLFVFDNRLISNFI